MPRPINSKKDRLPIMQKEFDKIILLTKRDKKMKSVTRKKLLRAYTILYVFGARVSEIVDFTMADIQYIYKNKHLIITETKSNSTQRLFINDKAIELLKQLDYSDVKEYLFYKNNSLDSMNTSGLTKLINTHLSYQLNVLYTSHSFRAGYITRIIEKTGDIKTAQKLARHKDINMTLRYMNVSDDRLNEVLDEIF